MRERYRRGNWRSSAEAPDFQRDRLGHGKTNLILLPDSEAKKDE
jgi:hypothetical protein